MNDPTTNPGGRPARWAGLLASIGLSLLTGVPIAAAQSDAAKSDAAAAAAPAGLKQLYVPAQDLEAILSRDKRGVLLPRGEFVDLLERARRNAIESPDIREGLIVVSAAHRARIAQSQLVITSTIKVRQLADGWRTLRLGLRGVSIESATLDGKPARLARCLDDDGLVELFHDTKGEHVLAMELAAPLASAGGERVAAFALARFAPATLSLAVPAGERLLVDELQLERPAPVDKPAEYAIPIGRDEEIRLRISAHEQEHAADRLLFADTAYRIAVSPGDSAWQALTSLNAFGASIDRLTFLVPASLRIAEVESTGLESWNVAEQTDGKPTTVTLSYRQPFKGTRTIAFKGILRSEAGSRTVVAALKIAGVTSHVGRIQIEHPPELRLKLGASSQARPTDVEGSVAAQREATVGFAQRQRLAFDVWNEDYSLVFTTEPKQREIFVTMLTTVDVAAQGLDLQVAARLESLYGPLFEAEVNLPADWSISSVTVGGRTAEWRSAPSEAGVHHLIVPISPPVPAGASVALVLAARRDLAPWPIDETGSEFALPEVRFLNAGVLVGSYAIKASEDFDLTPIDVNGLDPAHLKLGRERIGYRYQDSRFSGKVKIVRRPARLSAETILVSRLDSAALRTYLETTIGSEGGGFRRLDYLLPDSVGRDVRFTSDRADARIVEQKVSEPVRGQRIWSLTFGQYVKGTIRLRAIIDLRRGEAKEFRVPEPQIVGVVRQSGYVVVQAATDQRMAVTARGKDQAPLREIDLADLPPLLFAPNDRPVAAYQFVEPGSQVTLAEAKFAAIPLARAVCTDCTIKTLLGKTGRLQHEAAYQLVESGVQSLNVLMPESAVVWAALFDGQPVEMRAAGNAYQIPVKAAAANAAHTLTLFYATANASSESPAGPQIGALLDRTSRLAQSPPEIFVVSSSGKSEPLEVLERSWHVFYPSDMHLAKSDGSFRPSVALEPASVLGSVAGDLGIGSTTRLLWKLVGAAIAVGVALLVALGYARLNLAGVLLTFLIVGIIGFVTVLALSPHTAQESAKSYPAKSEPMEMAKSAESPMASPSQRSRWFFDQSGPKKPASPAPPKSAEPTDRQAAGLSPVGGSEQSVKGGAMGGGVSAAPAGNRPQAVTGGGRLSVPVQFEVPANHVGREFQFLGSETGSGRPPRLDVRYESLSAVRMLVLAVAAAWTYLFWCLRRAPFRFKSLLSVLGIVFPLAFITVAPALAQPWLDGIFFGTLCGTAIWLLFACGRTGDSATHRTAAAGLPAAPPAQVTLLFVAIGLAVTAQPARAQLVAADGANANQKSSDAADQRSNANAASESPRVEHPEANRPGDPSAPNAPPSNAPDRNRIVAPPAPPAARFRGVVVPYDDPKQPLRGDRVFLDRKTFLDLWNRAHPDKRLGVRAPIDGGVSGAIYSARLVAEVKEERGARIAVTGRIVIESFVDRPQNVVLPFRQAAIRSAKLDDRPAPLVPHREAEPKPAQPSQGRLDVVIASRGTHVLDVEFDVPARATGPAGEFTLHLLPVPSGRLAFELPQSASNVRVTGADAGFRRNKDGGKETIDVPVAAASDLTIAWQPERESGTAGKAVEANGTTAITIDDSGLRVRARYLMRALQGPVTELIFTLPPQVKLQELRGPDVAGWKVEGADASRRVIVSLRRGVSGETPIDIDLYQEIDIKESAATLAAPLLTPQGTVRDTGTVGLFAGAQFDVRSGAASGLTQIDAGEFAAPPSARPPAGKADLAYRYVAHPTRLDWIVGRRRPETEGSAEHAVVIGRRKLQLSSRIRAHVAGTTVLRATVNVPEGFLPLSVAGTGVADWFLSGAGQGAKTLIVEFASPRRGDFELTLSGTIARNPDETKVSLQVASLADVRRFESRLAAWVDESYQSTIEQSEGWRPLDPGQLSAQTKALRPERAQFAFETSRAQPAPIAFNLQRATPRMSGDSVAIITATDTSTFYTLALQWNVVQAAGDTFTLTTPEWLAGRLDFRDPRTVNAMSARLRQVTSVRLADGRIRWTISLQDPVRDRFFLAATAVLPPPADKKISAPLLSFENEQIVGDERRLESLATQRHFVVLVNQSSAQLTPQNADVLETVEKQDIPIEVDAALLRQALRVGRLSRANAAPVWQAERPSIEKGAAAVVNLADLVTVIEHGGTWRTKAIYKIKNRSRQFLPVRIPEGAEILSVFVQDKPSRAVVLKRGGESLYLVPLPAVSQADLAFDVRIVAAGRLASSLPDGTRLFAQKFALPAPQVVSLEIDPEYGVAVARTQWTTYFPRDEEVDSVSDPAQTNVNPSDENEAVLLERSAMLDEAKQLFSVLESESGGKANYRAISNLKQLAVALKQQRAANRDAEWSRRTSLEREEAGLGQEIARIESRFNVDAKNRIAVGNGRSDGDALFGLAGQDAQAIKLLEDNTPTSGINRRSGDRSVDFNVNGMFESLDFGYRPTSVDDSSKDNSTPTPRSSKRMLDRPWSSSSGDLKSDKRRQSSFDGSVNKELESLSIQQRAVQQPQRQNGQRPRADQSGNAGGGGFPQSDKLQPPSEAAPVHGPMDEMRESRQAVEQGAPPVERTPGTLSLNFDIPEAGRKLVFTKAGGDPKLTVTVRPRESLDRLFALGWTVVWVVLGISVAAALAGRSAENPLLGRRALYGIVIVAGLMSFLLLKAPFSWIGLTVLAAASAAEMVRRTRRASAQS